jgi:hypothetical protein
MKFKSLQVDSTQRIIHQHTIKLSKIKDKKNISFVNSKRKKFLTYKGASIKLPVGFTAKILHARREKGMIFSKCWEKNTVNEGYFV